VFIWAQLLIRLAISYWSGIMSSLPASILEKSNMSLMIPSSRSHELYILSNPFSISVGRFSCSINISVMPRIAFIGVRISWLILARKEDFALLASSAASRALSLSEPAIASAIKSARDDVKFCSSNIHSRFSGNSLQRSCSIQTTPTNLPSICIGASSVAHNLGPYPSSKISCDKSWFLISFVTINRSEWSSFA
jgi:hypothetical protein